MNIYDFEHTESSKQLQQNHSLAFGMQEPATAKLTAQSPIDIVGRKFSTSYIDRNGLQVQTEHSLSKPMNSQI